MNELVVKGVDDLMVLGRMFESSGMFGCSQQGQGLVLAMTCVMERITPLQFMNTYHIIGGRPTMKADAMLAQFHKLGGQSAINVRTPAEASVSLEFQGVSHGFKFTFEEALKEKFPYKKDGITLKDNWATPRMRMQMLWARVVSDGIRAICPQVNYGRYTPEEIQDIQKEKAVPVKSEVVVETKVVEPEPPADPGVIPVGKLKGKMWSDLDDRQLALAAGWSHPAMTTKMKEVIQNIIEARKPKEAKSGKRKESAGKNKGDNTVPKAGK